MRQPTLALALALALAAAVPAADAAGRADLTAMIGAFVAEEVGDAGPERQAAISACILSAFDGIDDAALASILDRDDFEDSLGALVEAHPGREATIEACEEL